MTYCPSFVNILINFQSRSKKSCNLIFESHLLMTKNSSIKILKKYQQAVALTDIDISALLSLTLTLGQPKI